LQQLNSPQAKAIIPDPKLRAGLFTLACTSASAAIDSVLTSSNQSGKAYASIGYDSTLSDGVAVANGNSSGSARNEVREVKLICWQGFTKSGQLGLMR
jgi:hypothetical protein